jgi:hypothetical protein
MRPLSPHDVAVASGGQFSLSNGARAWTALWLALRALGWTASATTATSPSSPPVRLSFKPGSACLPGGLISNPLFYELAMGWPVGWTEPGQPVTGYAAWLRRSRGQFSKLITAFDAEP